MAEKLYVSGAPCTRKEARDVVSSALMRFADRYATTVPEIIEGSRRRDVVLARHSTIREIHEKLPHWSVGRIAEALGIDHTSVCYALGRCGNKKVRPPLDRR